MNTFQPLLPSVLLRHVNTRVEGIIGLLKLVGIGYMSRALNDEIRDLHNLILDHICDDPEAYAESASAMLRLRDFMVLQTTAKAIHEGTKGT